MKPSQSPLAPRAVDECLDRVRNLFACSLHEIEQKKMNPENVRRKAASRTTTERREAFESAGFFGEPKVAQVIHAYTRLSDAAHPGKSGKKAPEHCELFR